MAALEAAAIWTCGLGIRRLRLRCMGGLRVARFISAAPRRCVSPGELGVRGATWTCNGRGGGRRGSPARVPLPPLWSDSRTASVPRREGSAFCWGWLPSSRVAFRSKPDILRHSQRALARLPANGLKPRRGARLDPCRGTDSGHSGLNIYLWIDGHHVVHWSHGGDADLDNLGRH
jgi:hypothetical protein